MANIIVRSLTDRERVDSVLGKNIPSCGQVYSDRTAWIMACLSELAYIKFNAGKSQKFSFDLDKMKKKTDDDVLGFLRKLIDSMEYAHEREKKNLRKELKNLRMELIETFDDNGTQAILVSCEKFPCEEFPCEEFIALVFRGTELECIQDIRTSIDLKKTQCETGGGIHSGFKEAFDCVAIDIQTKIDDSKFKDKPLFITGHSLGGALATIAAKKLKHEGGIAACYTFGSPRVGDDEWISDIKTPIYRLVNSADCVTMLPTRGGIMHFVLLLLLPLLPLLLLLPFSPFWSLLPCWPLLPCWRVVLIGLLVITILLRILGCLQTPGFGRYMHAGNMRYMTNCKNGQYKNVKLLYSAGLYFRLFPRRPIGWWKVNYPLTRFVVDHSISIYRKKLMVIAEKRNQKT